MDGAFLPPGQDIARRETVTELCARRDNALRLYAAAAEMLRQARVEHRKACNGLNLVSEVPLNELRNGRNDDFVAQAREIIDRDMWRGLLVFTELGALMDQQERQLFDQSLSDPPEVTPDTVFATIDRLAMDAGKIFRRGLVNAFKGLSREFRSHDGFKIGGRVILGHTFDVNVYGRSTSVYFSSYGAERLHDIDRVFHRLGGKKPPEYSQGVCQAIRDAIRREQWEVETPYFRVKWYKNGNAHMWFKDPEQVALCNRLIAEHFGLVVGAGPDVANKSDWHSAPVDPNLDDFYETPEWLALEMVNRADIQPHHKVLEPSAGEGAIARHIAPLVGARLTCIEASSARVQKLKKAFPQAKVHCDDFLQFWAEQDWDRILMNPPFSKNADVAHVARAVKALKIRRGGRLVAIMSAGILFRTDRATKALRAEIEAFGGSIEPLPVNTFKEAGTGINTALVVVDFD